MLTLGARSGIVLFQLTPPSALRKMPAGCGEFSTPVSTLSGVPGATARLKTGSAVGAVPWANAHVGTAAKASNIRNPPTNARFMNCPVQMP